MTEELTLSEEEQRDSNKVEKEYKEIFQELQQACSLMKKRLDTSGLSYIFNMSRKQAKQLDKWMKGTPI